MRRCRIGGREHGGLTVVADELVAINDVVAEEENVTVVSIVRL